MCCSLQTKWADRGAAVLRANSCHTFLAEKRRCWMWQSRKHWPAMHKWSFMTNLSWLYLSQKLAALLEAGAEDRAGLKGARRSRALFLGDGSLQRLRIWATDPKCQRRRRGDSPHQLHQWHTGNKPLKQNEQSEIFQTDRSAIISHLRDQVLHKISSKVSFKSVHGIRTHTTRTTHCLQAVNADDGFSLEQRTMCQKS